MRRGTKELTFVKYNHAIVEDQKDSRGEKPVVPLLPHVDEEKLPYILEDQPAEAIEPRSITWRQSAFLIWRQWRRRLLGNQWEVRPAIANIATSAIAFAPLSTTGHYLLPARARPRQTVVIEYDQQQPPGDHRYELIRLNPQLMNSQTHICIGMEMLVHPVSAPFARPRKRMSTTRTHSRA